MENTCLLYETGVNEKKITYIKNLLFSLILLIPLETVYVYILNVYMWVTMNFLANS